MDEKTPQKGSYTALELDDHKDKTRSDQEETTSINVHDNIEEPFNAEFWEKVCVQQYLSKQMFLQKRNVFLIEKYFFEIYNFTF